MKCLGAKAVVVTNASGGLHPDWDVGTIVAMHDHLSLPTLTVRCVHWGGALEGVIDGFTC